MRGYCPKPRPILIDQASSIPEIPTLPLWLDIVDARTNRVTLSTIKAAGSYHIAIIQSLPNSPVQFDDTLAAGLTMIFPTMYGWIVQIYGYSPGDAKV